MDYSTVRRQAIFILFNDPSDARLACLNARIPTASMQVETPPPSSLSTVTYQPEANIDVLPLFLELGATTAPPPLQVLDSFLTSHNARPGTPYSMGSCDDGDETGDDDDDDDEGRGGGRSGEGDGDCSVGSRVTPVPEDRGVGVVSDSEVLAYVRMSIRISGGPTQ